MDNISKEDLIIFNEVLDKLEIIKKGGDNDKNNYDFNILKVICFILGGVGFLLICYIMRKKEKRDDK